MLILSWLIVGVLLCALNESAEPNRYGWRVHLAVALLWPVFLVIVLYRRHRDGANT